MVLNIDNDIPLRKSNLKFVRKTASVSFKQATFMEAHPEINWSCVFQNAINEIMSKVESESVRKPKK